MADVLDELDVRLLELLTTHPRVGILEISRLAGVARATVSARLARLEAAGIVTGYGPSLDLEAAGYRVQALATLEIAQGRLYEVADLLVGLPGVIEAYSTTGTGDIVCRLAAESNDRLQQLLLDLNASELVRHTASVVILSVLVPARTLPLLRQPRERGANEHDKTRRRRARSGG